jgi:geranylgeranyl reductase family protein
VKHPEVISKAPGMSESSTYDVIIVGAGPAGALLAYLLAIKDIRVLLIEKKNLPRYKPCAGGLTPRVMALIPFDVSEVIEDECFLVKAFVHGKPVFVIRREYPVIRMVMRSRLDHFMVMKAAHAGATVREGLIFKSLSGSVGEINVETSGGTFKSRLIVGADGVNSRVARALGVRVRRHIMNALAGEIHYPEPTYLRDFRNTAHFDFGLVPQGYAWVFPKNGHLSVGVLSVMKKLKNMKPYFEAYLKAKNLYDSAEVRSLKAHSIPYGPDRGNVLATEKGLLVGDTTGFADPITGEGIFYALREVHVASKFILDGLRYGYDRLRGYTPTLWREIGNDLVYAKRFATVLYKWPRFSSRIISAHGQKLGNLHIGVFHGETSYESLYQEVFSLAVLRAVGSLFLSYFSINRRFQ